MTHRRRASYNFRNLYESYDKVGLERDTLPTSELG
jgi:hypothetical protein